MKRSESPSEEPGKVGDIDDAEGKLSQACCLCMFVGRYTLQLKSLRSLTQLTNISLLCVVLMPMQLTIPRNGPEWMPVALPTPLPRR